MSAPDVNSASNTVMADRAVVEASPRLERKRVTASNLVIADAAVVEASPRTERKRATKERSIDDYKRKIWKLKKELEEHRSLALAVQQDEMEKQRQVSNYYRPTPIVIRVTNCASLTSFSAVSPSTADHSHQYTG